MMSNRIDPALAVLGEFGLIGRIRERIRHRSSGTVLGIGDDAAVLRLDPGRELLATTDMLLEGVHFKREWGCGFALGRKTLAVNLSDIAAMGGQPLYALLGLGIPAAGITLAEVEEVLAGLEAEADAWGVTLAGGDTCGSQSGLVLSVTLLGEAPAGRAIRRSGAQPGDGLWVTGRLGGSAAGLLALEMGLRSDAPWPSHVGRPEWLGPEEEAAIQAAVSAHLTPVPRLAAGQALLQYATAMIDLSDGIASDAGHLCRESRVGVQFFACQLPVHSGATVMARWTGRDVLDLVLRGGEDYELLFASGTDPRPILAGAAPGLSVARIGEVHAGPPEVTLTGADGHTEVLAGGFDHFRPGV
ncbi:MAG TPA: thiamine-phosphate kinase [Candidatus Methylomirabilis sp.]